MLNLYAFIQARTTSTRLPGKVLLPLPSNSEEVLLSQIIFRLNKVLPIDKIVLLIPKEDEQLLEFTKKSGVQCFEGDELDVRDRFIRAAELYQADVIIRLTADNPAIDIEHIELLIEAFYTNQADIMSFENLPLGTGVEIFRSAAVKKNPITGILEKHREHVSLHLKEYPEEFRFIKLKPLLDDSITSTSHLIRFTVDEKKDYEMVDKVYQILYPKNPIFGIRDIYNLYKQEPEIFDYNSGVEQKYYPVQIIKKNLKKIFILYANPTKFGSGHLERCKVLFTKLQTYHYSVDMNDKLPKHLVFDLYIIDHRDLEVPVVLKNNKVLLIDNYGTDRNKFYRFDALPHPRIPFSETVKNFLFPQILENYHSIANNSKKILVYAGGLEERESDILDSCIYHLSENTHKIIRIGGYPRTKYSIQLIPRLNKYDFIEEIHNSEIFCSYFGQSLLEAFYLQKKVVLYSISDYHTILSEYFSSQTNTTFIGQLPDLKKVTLNELQINTIHIKNIGYNNLINKINQILTS
ncbi:MAG: spore coat biosynthesis protein F [Leptospiraceae bacterium]|nr:spore coat biosynthesis protein F [Leptospiraceae bacterium]MCP5494040.1 spore coat biosynthesis protein F [Leptospiraceae bacterium]